ncbi:MAG: cadmium-translocating P-type ATPase [Devosia sp.]|nr:cadmium-translocating P-type ATPase [Devosia sp.]
MTLELTDLPDELSKHNELSEYVERGPDGARQICFAVPDAYCATCIEAIESGLGKVEGVSNARVNLSQRRVVIQHDESLDLAALGPAISLSGYRNFPVDPADLSSKDKTMAELVRSLAVAGFAAGNIMLFSVSVWSGADEATRDLFHWLSALIALPAVAYAGRPFFRSAFAALRVGRTNMDVPIAIGIAATTTLSLFETIVGGSHAYFDASTMLLFFLLAGRTLDHMMRARARGAVENLARLQPRGAVQLHADGTSSFVRLAAIEPGMHLQLRAGERVPVDSVVVGEAGEFDLALVSGESQPVTIGAGASVPAGAANLGGVVQLEAMRASADSFLSRMASMMGAAEEVRTRYRRIADRVSRHYAPVIHLTAAATFVLWVVLANPHTALLHAVAVLIITCPCALALAVPIVHVVAAGRLFERGILLRDGAALERLAKVGVVAFDKTGTLTEGKPQLVGVDSDMQDALARAAWLAGASSHPLSQAIVAAAAGNDLGMAMARETAGAGVEAEADGIVWRLGNAAFCNGRDEFDDTQSRVWLSRNGEPVATFRFSDRPRPDAAATLQALERARVPSTILSGDRPHVVAAIASELGASDFRAALSPSDKLDAIAALRAERGTVLMVGDGINDAPAMRAADISMAPGSAADIGRAAADLVLTRDRLDDVPFAIALARRAEVLVRENLIFSVLYNVVVLPLAIAGYVTPLIAAIAMSTSSLVVVLNAMRLRFYKFDTTNEGASR